MKSLPGFLLFALAGASSLLASPAPLVHVARTERPPAIHGESEDPQWEHAIAIQDFLAPDSRRPLVEKTEVRLLWDKNALYLSARLEESLLSVAGQQQHEIRAGAKERDGNVINDDSFILILHPAGAAAAFEFDINTRGRLADAKSDPANPWKTRDLAWNANIDAEARVEDGFWTVRMAIPWRELGVPAPKPGEQWETVIARNAAARRESGSWNPSHGGIHAPETWGCLLFGEAAPGVRLATPLSTLEGGKNRLEFGIVPGREAGSLLVATKIATEGKRTPPVRSRKVIPVPKGKPFAAAFDFDAKEAGGAAAFSWSVADAATLEPLYQSPEMAFEIEASSVTLNLQTPGPYRLLVNDLPVAKGEKAEGEPLKIPLHSGANVLALETRSGTARVKLESPALGDAPIAWKMDDSGDPRALRASTDDSQWENAPVSETGETGRAGKPAVLRHTILVQETRLFPAPLPVLFIAGGGIQPVTFTAFGLPGKTLREWNIYLELPEAVEAIGASGYYGNRDKKPRFSLHPEKPGSGNPRYRVEASQPVAARAPGSPVILSVFDVALRQKEAAAVAAPESAVLRHFGRANANTVSELAQNTPLRLLPKLRGRQLKNLTFQLWGSYTLNLDDPEIRAALLSTARAAGFNDFVGIPGSDAGKFGLTSTLLVNFKSHSLDLAPWLREHPEDRLINARGQPDDSLLCTTVLLASGWKEAGAPLLEQWWERRKPDTVNYDYEYPPFRGPHSCYCPRCLEAFRKAAGLDPAEPLDPSKIQEKYAAQWVDFMARRIAALFLLMKNTVHELPGKVKFEAYSGYQTPDNAAKYGVDWRHVGELHAVDRAGVGYGRPIPGIAETLRALPGIPVLFGELVTPYLTNERLDGTRPVHPVTKAALLLRFIDSDGGALVYNTQNMEGRSWFAAAETSRLVAEYEAFFGDGKATPLPGQPEEDVCLIQKEGGSLVCVMNPGRVEKTYAFPLDPALGGGREFYSGQAVEAGETIRLTLPAGESAVYILNKQ